MKYVIGFAMLLIAAVYCESAENIKKYYIEKYVKSCCDRLEPNSECYIEEWSGGDINFYVLIKTGTVVKKIPIDQFIDYCQCSECCE